MLQPFNQILAIKLSGYPLNHDRYYLIMAAYMKQIKKYAVVMSNLIGVYQQIARQFNSTSLPLDKLARRRCCIISTASPPGKLPSAGNMKQIKEYTRTVSV